MTDMILKDASGWKGCESIDAMLECRVYIRTLSRITQRWPGRVTQGFWLSNREDSGCVSTSRMKIRWRKIENMLFNHLCGTSTSSLSRPIPQAIVKGLHR